ncbi:uncharacterized protein [Physcomitrium patens]|nr:ELMO domain-containing protein C-like [Physcomitrium patens]XP_024385248.1 ELMO domain-containing protein C-like [Physcomitrium patens]XP_024385249.1 ELMO domain-containing protein C-like [Physcomitrium patens]XP_024385250.1 ELMO domain-containing protein C-like [Physcomitrium patens]XP_024385251.1 ELMO domain-containing protein C-like [Physcomitrium patens]XP_024385252.1 ELMO domain-containing protein C-like [Physcomitrium patens]XP_024385253.1 ELMO domain-containing protein C-like [Physc|eukprot:XP_024385247.1 ELMO domain-containing protein C-like [Physcomitrella patens]
MNSAGALRRRIHHEDVGGRKYDRESSSAVEGLNEPLLGNHSSDDDDDRDWRDKKRREDQVWTHNVSKLLAQWAQWFSIVVLAGGFRVGNNLFMAVLGRQFHGGGGDKPDYYLSPVQVGRLEKLQQRLAVPFDGTLPQHQDALKALWQASFPERAMPGLVSPQWKDMGWQGNDPSTDFRGGGFISLENLLFFARRFPAVFQRLLHKEEGKRAEWEYPFAVGGLNITFMLIQLLDLRAAKPNSSSAASFFNILATDENAFDMLYCVAFQLLDAQWLALGASYMEFNVVLQATRSQLEKELALDDVDRVEDLPSYVALVNST